MAIIKLADAMIQLCIYILRQRQADGQPRRQPIDVSQLVDFSQSEGKVNIGGVGLHFHHRADSFLTFSVERTLR